jgi:hypothetical protein
MCVQDLSEPGKLMETAKILLDSNSHVRVTPKGYCYAPKYDVHNKADIVALIERVR